MSSDEEGEREMWREAARMRRSRKAAARGRDEGAELMRTEDMPRVEMVAVAAEDRVRGQKRGNISK